MSSEIGVLVDVIGIGHALSYRVPAGLVEALGARAGVRASSLTALPIGTMVKVPLNNRAVGGWVVEPPADTTAEGELSLGGARALLDVKRVLGPGPPEAVVELARWAATRWLGAPQHFLRTASPARPLGLPLTVAGAGGGERAAAPHDVDAGVDSFGVDDAEVVELATQALASEQVVALRVGPCADPWAVIAAALATGRTLVVAPTLAVARRLAARARAARVSVAVMDVDWHQARTAQLVVGARTAAWAPMASLDAVVVLDEASSLHQGQKTPAWNARDVAVERARREGARCLVVSAAHSPVALSVAGSVAGTSATAETSAWARVEVIDRRDEDPAAAGWCSPRLGRLLGEPARAHEVTLIVLNRTGRYGLAICASCGELARGASTGRALAVADGEFVDPSTNERQPMICVSCGALRFRRTRIGTKGVVAELEAVSAIEVVEVVGETKGGSRPHEPTERVGRSAGLFVGTEALLHRAERADNVVFLDFDQELLAPRFRANEEAMALLCGAARLVGPRASSGRVLTQTRMASHPVLAAAVSGQTGAWSVAEADDRRARAQPPFARWVLVSGAGAGEFVRSASGAIERADDVSAEIGAAGDDTWRIASAEGDRLLDVLAGVRRPKERTRIEVDPLRV